jgi:hypothetical protein
LAFKIDFHDEKHEDDSETYLKSLTNEKIGSMPTREKIISHI